MTCYIKNVILLITNVKDFQWKGIKSDNFLQLNSELRNSAFSQRKYNFNLGNYN